MITYTHFELSKFRLTILAFPQRCCVATPLNSVPYGIQNPLIALHRQGYTSADAQAVCDWLNQRVEYHKNLRFHPPTAGVVHENVLPTDTPGLCVRGVRCEQPGNRDNAHSPPEPQPLRPGCAGAAEPAARHLTTESNPFHSPAPPLGPELDSGAVRATIDPLDGSRGVSSAFNSGTPAAGAGDLEGGDITLSAQELAEAALLTSRETY